MSVKSYPYNCTIQLTKNFNASEFRCKCGKYHNIYISEEEVQMLQKFCDLVGADYVLISSGHRCSSHDRSVGGYGSGPHVEGFAADCQFVKNGTAIDTRILSCIAQDLGFMGIANITSDYKWIHLDMKGRVYKGNEVVNYNTVTNDFYAYYNISREKVLELTNGVSTGNNNTSSTSNTTKINSKDKKKNFVWTNTYDPKIKELQHIFNEKGYNLIEDGYAGPNTYAVAKKFTIEKGDRGPLTRWIQERITELGYDCGFQDGIAGYQTMDGIKAFQKAHGLGQGYLGGTDWVYVLGGSIK